MLFSGSKSGLQETMEVLMPPIITCARVSLSSRIYHTAFAADVDSEEDQTSRVTCVGSFVLVFDLGHRPKNLRCLLCFLANYVL